MVNLVWMQGMDGQSEFILFTGWGLGEWKWVVVLFFLSFLLNTMGWGRYGGGKLLLFVCVGFTIMNHQGVKIYMSFVAIVQSIV